MSGKKLPGKPKLPNVLTYLVARSKTWLSSQGRNEGDMGGTIPRAPNCYWSAKWLRGAPKSPNNVTTHKYFLQYSEFASEKTQVRTSGCQTCFLSRAPFNLVTPLSVPILLIQEKLFAKLAIMQL